MLVEPAAAAAETVAEEFEVEVEGEEGEENATASPSRLQIFTAELFPGEGLWWMVKAFEGAWSARPVPPSMKSKWQV